MAIDRQVHARDPDNPNQMPSTVHPDGTPRLELPDGVRLRSLRTHLDPRGSLTEFWDIRWALDDEPVRFGELVTVRPDVVKGWVRHLQRWDRLTCCHGEIEAALFDDRPGSPTHGMVSTFTTGPRDPTMLVLPPGIWHAFRCLSPHEAIIVGLPSTVYDHEAPDKQTLPIENTVIPFTFR